MTEIGLLNFIKSRGIEEDSVLDLRVVKSKSTLTSVGYTTVTSTVVAQKIIEEVHDRSPLNLSVKMKHPEDGNLAGHIKLPVPQQKASNNNKLEEKSVTSTKCNLPNNKANNRDIRAENVVKIPMTSDSDSDNDNSPFTSFPITTSSNVPQSSKSCTSDDSGRNKQNKVSIESITEKPEGSDSIDSKLVKLSHTSAPNSSSLKSSSAISNMESSSINSNTRTKHYVTLNETSPKTNKDGTDIDSDDAFAPFSTLPTSNKKVGVRVNDQESHISTDDSEDENLIENKVYNNIKKKVTSVPIVDFMNRSFASSLSSDDVDLTVMKYDKATATDNTNNTPVIGGNWTPVTLVKTVGYHPDTCSLHSVLMLDCSPKPVLTSYKVKFPFSILQLTYLLYLYLGQA